MTPYREYLIAQIAYYQAKPRVDRLDKLTYDIVVMTLQQALQKYDEMGQI